MNTKTPPFGAAFWLFYSFKKIMDKCYLIRDSNYIEKLCNIHINNLVLHKNTGIRH